MEKTLIILLIIYLSSCNSKINENETVESGNQTNDVIKPKIDTVSNIDNTTAKIPEVLKTGNGLVSNFQGTWINTSLFDSTSINKKLSPWLNEFYGDLLLIINENGTVEISGNMDGGSPKIELIDSLNFYIPNRVDNPTFTYSPQRDLIFENFTSDDQIIFRRVNENDNLDIIADEDAFNRYFIDNFFGDYFSESEKAKIVSIWDGFETYTPFEFDALVIKNDNGEVESYAWEFVGDTLLLFETSFEYDKDSGFANYKVEKLKQKLLNNKSW